MSNKNKNKKYVQAVKYYEEGELDKALKKCEEGISESLKNSGTLNFKGLLLYIKGDLQGALATWRINADFNDDSIAKNYINDAKQDKERLRLYKEGEVLLAKLSVSDAIGKFEKCKESDFNAVKVNLALASCYLKKADYPKVGVYLTKVLSMDKQNLQAIKLAKELKQITGENLQVMKSYEWINKVLIGTLACVVLGVCIVGGGKLIQNVDFASLVSRNSEDEEVEENIDLEVTEEQNTSENQKQEEVKTTENTEQKLVDVEALEVLIRKENFNDIYKSISSLDKSKLDEKEQAVVLKAENLLKDKGIDHFYNNGMDDFKNKNYQNAKENFEKAYKYGKQSYLYPHVVYFIAAIADKNNNSADAIKLYEEYYKNYKKGDYFEEALYRLAILYEAQDKDKSLAYAEELKYDHPDSIYNNEKIKELLKNN